LRAIHPGPQETVLARREADLKPEVRPLPAPLRARLEERLLVAARLKRDPKNPRNVALSSEHGSCPLQYCFHCAITSLAGTMGKSPGIISLKAYS
jgi:hypothetical protein